MTRQDALIRLHKTLLRAKERLSRKLTGELAYLHDDKAPAAAGDNADMAFMDGGDEMSLRLVEMQDQELSQIERALARWHQGKYGICDGGAANCQHKIPVTRLHALPFTPFCIHCERALEKSPDGSTPKLKGNWNRIYDSQATMHDRRIDLASIERASSGRPRG